MDNTDWVIKTTNNNPSGFMNDIIRWAERQHSMSHPTNNESKITCSSVGFSKN